MGRCKSELSVLSTFRWLYSFIAFILGFVPQSHLTGRVSKKQYKRRTNEILPNKRLRTSGTQRRFKIKQADTYQRASRKSQTELNNVFESSEGFGLKILNNNNIRNLDSIINDNMNISQSLDVDQQKVLCIRIENNQAAESIQYFLEKHALPFKDSQIFDLQELAQLMQPIVAKNKIFEDASTMTNTDQIVLCSNFLTQNENTCRLKAFEYIRIFIEMNKEDFLNYLINKEYLCQHKTLTIYQIIKQFVMTIYESEHEQEQNYISYDKN